MFTHKSLQDFTDTTRNKYKNGVKLPWNYGLVEFGVDDELIEELKKIQKPFAATKYSSFWQCGISKGCPLKYKDFKERYKVSDNFAIAGGYVLDILTGNLPNRSDIDVFSIGPTDIKYLKSKVKDFDYAYETSMAITYKNDGEKPVQYILWHADTISQLLYLFDIPIGQLCIWKGRLFATYECIFELYNGQIYPKNTRTSSSYMTRLKKYMIKKGVEVCFHGIKYPIKHPLLKVDVFGSMYDPFLDKTPPLNYKSDTKTGKLINLRKDSEKTNDGTWKDEKILIKPLGAPISNIIYEYAKKEALIYEFNDIFYPLRDGLNIHDLLYLYNN